MDLESPRLLQNALSVEADKTPKNIKNPKIVWHCYIRCHRNILIFMLIQQLRTLLMNLIFQVYMAPLGKFKFLRLFSVSQFIQK